MVPVVGEDGEYLRLDAALFDFDVEVKPVADQIERFGEGGDALAVAGVEGAQVGQREAIDRCSDAGGADQVAVVKHDGNAVGRDLNIELDAGGADLDRPD